MPSVKLDKPIPINPAKNIGRPPKPSTIIRYYQANPDKWLENAFGVQLWEKQREILHDVWNNRYVAVRSCYASGKCLAEDELVMLLDGTMVEARDLVGRQFDVLAFDERTKSLVPARAFATDNGHEDVWRVTTASGRSVVRTGNHPFYAVPYRKNSYISGTRSEPCGEPVWVKVNDLKKNHAILAPKSLPVLAVDRQPEDHVKLAAYLLGDGGLTTPTMTFTQMPGPVLDEFLEIVKRLGCETIPVTSNELGLRIAGRKKENGERYAAQHHTNWILNLAREWGIWGKRANEKRFPSWVWRLPDDQMALFLNRLFACDGWAYARERDLSRPKTGHFTQIGIALASKGMIQDIAWAMWRLGIWGVVRHRKVAGKYDAWEWSCNRAEDIVRFAEVVSIFGKEQALEHCVCAATKKKQRTRWLDHHAPDGFVWDPVKKVEFVGKRRTVCITVPGYETFVTMLVEHNSFLAASAAMAWSHLFKDSIVLTTARSFRQVRANVWQVIHQLKEQARIPLGSEFLQTEIRLGPGWYALGFATDDPGTIQGIHAKSGRILIIVDESAEVDAAIHERLLALMTSEHAHILHIGNPLEVGTVFHSYFSDPKYVTHRISAFDTPNVKEGREVIPGLVSKQWVEERRQEWGEDSPLWYSQVLGEFPPTGNDTLIPLSWVRAAQERWHDMAPSGREVAGVDISRYGNAESVCCIISGRFVHPLKTWSQASTSESVGYIRTYAAGAKIIRIDDIGVGGGVVDQARQEGLPVVGVNVQVKSSKPDKFFNLRSELYWNLRELLNPENPNALALPPDDKLAAQLSSIRYKIIDSGGRIQVESKDQMRSRGLKSPDRADALCLAAAGTIAGGLTVAPVMIGVGSSYWSQL